MSKPVTKVTLTIKPGPPTPAQLEATRRFWQRLFEQVKSEAPK